MSDTPEDLELLAILARDGPTGKSSDRKLLGSLATKPYWVAGMFIPTDPEQAEDALIKNSFIVLWRYERNTPEIEKELFDRFYGESQKHEVSINEVWNDFMRGWMNALPPHDLLAAMRDTGMSDEESLARMRDLKMNIKKESSDDQS